MFLSIATKRLCTGKSIVASPLYNVYVTGNAERMLVYKESIARKRSIMDQTILLLCVLPMSVIALCKNDQRKELKPQHQKEETVFQTDTGSIIQKMGEQGSNSYYRFRQSGRIFYFVKYGATVDLFFQFRFNVSRLTTVTRVAFQLASLYEENIRYHHWAGYYENECRLDSLQRDRKRQAFWEGCRSCVSVQ